MTYGEHLEAKRAAEAAGFPAHGECLTAEDGEEFVLVIQDVEAGRRLRFLHLASFRTYITAAVEKEMAFAG